MVYDSWRREIVRLIRLFVTVTSSTYSWIRSWRYLSNRRCRYGCNAGWDSYTHTGDLAMIWRCVGSGSQKVKSERERVKLAEQWKISQKKIERTISLPVLHSAGRLVSGLVFLLVGRQREK